MKLFGRVVKQDANWIHIELIGTPHTISLPAQEDKWEINSRVQVEVVSKPAKAGVTVEILEHDLPRKSQL